MGVTKEGERGALAVVAAAALWLGACGAESEVTTIGPQRPGLPPDCPVELFPGEPSYPVTAVAKVRVAHCSTGSRGSNCNGVLRSLACAYGADTVFGLSETITGEWTTGQTVDFAGGPDKETAPTTFLFATLAVRTGDALPACSPICSPGFACQAGQCVPQCNPACEKNEVCSRKRVCEAASAGGG